ncbi:MAG TPA: HD domain-containing protein [Gemmataceae bacterium]|nr:HD domain-containing protein [Gemmataceae bacterium]
MADSPASSYLPLFEAVAFAARAHQGQKRKDGATPYVSHVFRAALVVREVFGIEDVATLTAAVLHDTVEDTTTDFDDLEENFGAEVARWVGNLSKDKRLPEKEREHDYCERLAAAPWQVKVCKLADVYDNLNDSTHFPPEKQAKTRKNAQRYLEAVGRKLPEQARRPWQIVSELLAYHEQQAQRPR